MAELVQMTLFPPPPVFYSGMAGSMKAFMDRVFFSNRGRVAFALKPAAVVTSAGRAAGVEEPAPEPRVHELHPLATRAKLPSRCKQGERKV